MFRVTARVWGIICIRSTFRTIVTLGVEALVLRLGLGLCLELVLEL